MPRSRRASDPQHDGGTWTCLFRTPTTQDGLPLFGGTQLAIVTTLVSTLHCDGSARRGAAHRDGVALLTARRKKERTYPELIGPHAQARLGSEETIVLVPVARAKARSEPSIHCICESVEVRMGMYPGRTRWCMSSANEGLM